MSRGACKCIGLAEAIAEDQAALLFDPNDPEALARKKKRDIESLPIFLQPNPQVATLKRKAAKLMQRNQLQESKSLYQQVLQIVTHKLKEFLSNLQGDNHDPEEKVFIRRASEEVGRIESNLSLIAFKQQQYDEALSHAESAAAHHPSWSKPYSRKAMACEALGQLLQADMAIFKAMEKCEGEIEDGASKPHTRDEYQEIANRIAAKLEHVSDSETQTRLYIPVPTHEDMHLHTGSLLDLVLVQGILEQVLQFCTAVDYARLQQTCRYFAVTNSEQRSRITFSNALLNLKSSKVDEQVHRYCTQLLDDPKVAVAQLIFSLYQLYPPLGKSRLPFLHCFLTNLE